MDESWDADYEGDLRVPESVRGASESVRNETHAARELSRVTAKLKSILITEQHERLPHPLLINAMAIVQASTTDENDEIYNGDAWKKCKDSQLQVAGDSIEQVLAQANSILQEIMNIII